MNLPCSPSLPTSSCLYSTAAYTLTIDVTPVNDPPTSADNMVTTKEDTAYTFAASDFPYSDIEGDPLAQLQIKSLPADGTLELFGVAVTLNQVIGLEELNMGDLVFTPEADEHGGGYAGFGFRVQDGTDYSTVYTLSIDVTPVNDPPTSTDNTVSTNEDTTHTFSVADYPYSDVESDPLAQVQITALPAEGDLELSGTAVTVNQVVTTAELNAGNLTFTPEADENGTNYAGFGFRVQDGSGYSAAYTLTVDVTPVNDPPTSADNTVSTNEDTTYTFDASDYPYSDVESDPLAQLQITVLPVQGTLELSGTAVTLNQVITLANLNAGNLTFTPAANENGSGYAGIGFRVHDGSDYSAAYTLTVDVTPVNDPPTSTNNTVTTNEDTTHVFAATDFPYSDLENDPLAQVQIASLPANGTLALSGVAVTLNQVISAADLNAGNLTFTPAADAHGTNYANFNFHVHDGADYSAAHTQTIDITPVNDPPTSADNTVSTSEDTTFTFDASDFPYSDVENDPLSQIQITALPVQGALALSGTAVTLNQVISLANLNAGNLTFTPTANENGTGYTSFGFRLHDGTAYSAASYTLTVDVTPVNDLPIAADHAVATTEDTTYVFVAGDFNYSDIESDPFTQLQITSLPLEGALEHTGTAVTLNQVISVTDLNAGNLSFTPEENESGTNYASFGFRVHDGSDYSASSNTLTIDVTPANDPPTSANDSVTTSEDTAYAFTAADFPYSDLESDPLAQVQITSLPAKGALELSGAAVTAGQVITVTILNSGNLTFTPEADESGTNYAGFGFRVQDGSAYSAAYLIDARNHTGYQQILQETVTDADTGEIQKKVIYTIGVDLIAQTTIVYSAGVPGTPETLIFLYDGHGSVRVVVDPAADVLETYAYDAQGNPLGFDPATALTAILYAGEFLQKEIGLYNNRARYYDPVTGRFNRLDPFAGNNQDPISLHKYLYGNADPVNFTDPTGNFGLAASLGSLSVGNSIRNIHMATVTNIYGAVLSTVEGVQAGLTPNQIFLSYLLSDIFPIVGFFVSITPAARDMLEMGIFLEADDQSLSSSSTVTEPFAIDWIVNGGDDSASGFVNSGAAFAQAAATAAMARVPRGPRPGRDAVNSIRRNGRMVTARLKTVYRSGRRKIPVAGNVELSRMNAKRGVTGVEKNHINQHAAFKDLGPAGIPKGQGLSINLKGSSGQLGTQHNKFHKSLDDWWDKFRGPGVKPPTVRQYNDQLKNALESAGYERKTAGQIVVLAEKQQAGYNITHTMRFNRIPARTTAR